MAFDVHVEHLGQLTAGQFRRDHVPVGDGDAQAVDGAANRQVEQVEFVSTLGVDATDARGVQPVLPGPIGRASCRERG